MKFIADTHIHSIASNHAYSTIMENIEAARQKGLVYMAMTEHGPKMPDAPHIWHCVNQWEVPSVYNGVNILHGAEVDIMDEEALWILMIISLPDWNGLLLRCIHHVLSQAQKRTIQKHG